MENIISTSQDLIKDTFEYKVKIKMIKTQSSELIKKEKNLIMKIILIPYLGVKNYLEITKITSNRNLY